MLVHYIIVINNLVKGLGGGRGLPQEQTLNLTKISLFRIPKYVKRGNKWREEKEQGGEKRGQEKKESQGQSGFSRRILSKAPILQ